MKLQHVKMLMVIAVFVVALSMAACANDDGGAVAPPADTGTAAQVDAAADPTGDDDADAPVPVRFVKPGTHAPGYEEGMAAVSAQLQADGINVVMSTIRIPWDVYLERLNLMLATGEPFELLHIMQDVRNISSIAGIGAIISLEPYLDDFPGLVNHFDDIAWRGVEINGERFAVPAIWRSFEYTGGIALRLDVMRNVGFDEFPTHDLDAVIDLMLLTQEYVLEQTGIRAYHWLHQLNNNPDWLHRAHPNFPFLVDNGLGLILARQDGTIDSYYESEEFRWSSAFYRRLFQAGLLHPDMLTMEASLKWEHSGLGALVPGAGAHPGTTRAIEMNTDIVGAEVDLRKIYPERPDVFHLFVQNMNAVSSTAYDPTAALAFLQWLYASPENHDLYHYGIEGVHWHDMGDGFAYFVLDENDARLYVEDYWMTAYMGFFRHLEGTPQANVDFNNYVSQHFVVSPIAGFIFDTSELTTEITNLQIEIIASIYPIKFGMVDFDANIDSALANLRAAGLDRYMEEFRSQFADYLAANPDVLEMAQPTRR